LEMRKLLVVIILALILVSSLIGACLASDGVKTIVVNILLAVFGPVWIFISNGWSNLALTVGGSGAYFLLYTCVVGLFFIGLFLLLTRSRIAGKLPGTKKPETVSEAGYQTAPPTQPLPIPKKSASTVEPQPVANTENLQPILEAETAT